MLRQLAQRNNSQGFTGTNPYLDTYIRGAHSTGTFGPLKQDKWVPSEYIHLQEEMMEELDSFEKNQHELFFNTDPSTETYQQWIEPSLTLLVTPGRGLRASKEKYNIWVLITFFSLNNFVKDASTDFWRHARDILEIGIKNGTKTDQYVYMRLFGIISVVVWEWLLWHWTIMAFYDGQLCL